MSEVVSILSMLMDIFKIASNIFSDYKKYQEESNLAKELKDKNDKETEENLKRLLQ